MSSYSIREGNGDNRVGPQTRSVLIQEQARSFLVRTRESDIDQCIGFSGVRCFLSIVGFLLVLTDIPRTGLGISLRDFYPSVAPDTVTFWGPYVYPVIHINTTNTAITDSRDASDNNENASRFRGWKLETPMETARVWSYKFDTLSIAPRGIATHLGVSAYPPCVLYHGACIGTTLSLETVFSMLDGLVEAIRGRYFVAPHESRPVVYWTKNVWLDRLYSKILQFVWQREDIRQHTIHYYPPPKIDAHRGARICAINRLAAPAAQRTALPLICDNPIKWPCANPRNSSAPRIPLWEHIDLRLIQLHELYPNLTLDLLLFTTRFRVTFGRQDWLPRMSLLSATTEVTTLIRGRRCLTNLHTNITFRNCETVFVDDFRYERAVMESDERNWSKITTLLRGGAQGFVWVRVSLLWCGCYWARSCEPKLLTRGLVAKLRAGVSTFFKIPSHVVIYGSWIPIICYALSHLIDSGVVHIAGEYFWTTVNGQFNFSIVRFVLLASIQMRNIWLVALLWKFVVVVYGRVQRARQQPWDVRDGVLGLRGMMITMSSTLTIFSYLRMLSFRDTSILEFHELPRHAPFNGNRARDLYLNAAQYGIRFDIKVVGAAIVMVSGVLLLQQSALEVLTQQKSNMFGCRNLYIPESANTLWPRSALSLFWFVRWRRQPDRNSRRFALGQMLSSIHRHERIHRGGSVAVRPNSTPQPAPCGSGSSRCAVCMLRPSVFVWRDVQGCLRHDHLARVYQRSRRIQSLIRLMNIAMMTDPVVIVQLAILGRPLYVYHRNEQMLLPNAATSHHSAGSTSDSNPPRTQSLFLLPRRLNVDLDAPLGFFFASGSRPRCTLVAVTNSASIPWDVLIDVG